jgi:hypothetical protein
MVHQELARPWSSEIEDELEPDRRARTGVWELRVTEIAPIGIDADLVMSVSPVDSPDVEAQVNVRLILCDTQRSELECRRHARARPGRAV